MFRDGSVIVGEWGDCDFANIECRVLPPAPAPRPQPPPEITQDLAQQVIIRIIIVFKCFTLGIRRHAFPETPYPGSFTIPACTSCTAAAHGLAPQAPGYSRFAGLSLDCKLDIAQMSSSFYWVPEEHPPDHLSKIWRRKESGLRCRGYLGHLGHPTRLLLSRWTDKSWPQQWYLNRGGRLDMNVEEAWDLGEQ